MPEFIATLWEALVESLPHLVVIAGVTAGGLGVIGFACLRAAAQADREADVAYAQLVAKRAEREAKAQALAARAVSRRSAELAARMDPEQWERGVEAVAAAVTRFTAAEADWFADVEGDDLITCTKCGHRMVFSLDEGHVLDLERDGDDWPRSW
jgi:hypothetical protein